jgi:hypothetical protein
MFDAGPDQVEIQCGLTLEDEFVLTRVKNKARELSGKDREQYLWQTILKLVCRERAYKMVLDELGVAVDTNIKEI